MSLRPNNSVASGFSSTYASGADLSTGTSNSRKLFDAGDISVEVTILMQDSLTKTNYQVSLVLDSFGQKVVQIESYDAEGKRQLKAKFAVGGQNHDKESILFKTYYQVIALAAQKNDRIKAQLENSALGKACQL